MTSSLFDNKENEFTNYSAFGEKPGHQGRAFKIQIGQSNGPFLSKDLMHSNQKSTYLLAAKNILQAHKSMSNMMGILTKEQQNQWCTIRNSSNVENWFSKCQFLAGELAYIESQSKKLSREQQRLKIQFRSSFQYLVEQNEQMQQSFAPLFKNLLRTIREHNNEERNIFEEHKRDIQELNKFRNVYLDELVNCERRIIRVEQFLGIEQEGEK